MIWLAPVASLALATVVVSAVARRVEREVAATSEAVEDAVDALGGMSGELERAQEHLERLSASTTRRRFLARRGRRRPVRSKP